MATVASLAARVDLRKRVATGWVGWGMWMGSCGTDPLLVPRWLAVREGMAAVKAQVQASAALRLEAGRAASETRRASGMWSRAGALVGAAVVAGVEALAAGVAGVAGLAGAAAASMARKARR
jgi:hypothetical protein